MKENQPVKYLNNSMPKQYGELYILKMHEETATLASREPDDDDVLEEAIYYHTLYSSPTPWESADDHPSKGTVYHDNTEYDDLPPAA